MAKPTMLDYVLETPDVIRRQLADDPAAPLAEAFLAGKYSRVRIVACGSSRNGSLIARHTLRWLLGREVTVTEPYTFCAYEHELADDEFCFVVSQSGYSTNSLEALSVIREAGRQAIGVTGDPESAFREASDLLVDYGVGYEGVGYVTKGVTSFAVFLMLFGARVALAEGRMTDAEHAAFLAQLDAIAGAFADVAEKSAGLIESRYKELSSLERVFIVGAGTNYGVACEGALKLAECLQIPAQAHELDEYLHGPDLQLTPAYAVFFVAVGQRDWSRTRQMVEATRIVTDHVFYITDDPEAVRPDILLPRLEPELAAPLAALAFFQRATWQMTEDKQVWRKHPLVREFDRKLAAKSEGYVDKEEL